MVCVDVGYGRAMNHLAIRYGLNGHWYVVIRHSRWRHYLPALTYFDRHPATCYNSPQRR